MSKTSLTREIKDLKQIVFGASTVFQMKTQFFSCLCYWSLLPAEVEEKHRKVGLREFKTVAEANTWALEDARKEFPEAVEDLLKHRSLEDVLQDRWLSLQVPMGTA